MAFSLTSAAAQEILAAAERSQLAGLPIRIAAQPGAGGLRFGMGFDDPAEGDAVGQFEGVTVLIAPASQPWLEGIVLDFVEVAEGQRDFVFLQEEPGAAGAGCGPAQGGGCGGGTCPGCAR